MDTDRRQEIRIPLVLPLECQGIGNATDYAPKHEMACQDLSCGGMSLTSEMPLDVGKTLVFSLSLPHGRKHDGIAGAVRWCAGPPEPRKIGIQFSKPLDFSVPLSVTTKAVGSLQQYSQSVVERLYASSSDAFVHQLEQVTHALEDDFPGHVVLLNSDLTIAQVRGAHTTGKKEKRKVARLRGKDLRKVTGLTEIKVNGQRLFDVLEFCAQTGRKSEIQRCHYQGRSGSAPDLFTPGTFRTKITPIHDLEGEIASLLMRVSLEDPLGIHDHQDDKGQKNQNRLGKILGAAATGFLLKNVLKRLDNPLTHLLTEMDLFRSKLERHTPISPLNDEEKTPLKALGIDQARKNVGTVCEKLRQVLENMSSTGPQEGNQQQVNRCLSKAIQTAEMAEGMEGIAITSEMGSGLPQAKTNGQELTMAFLIFLLLSKDCLSNVSHRAIHCKTRRNGDLIVAGISHNGFIQQNGYLKILFHHNPLEDFFLNCATVNPADTLLYYANFLLKKNDIRIKLTNIPGHFNLSLIIPATVQ
jgi:hypothetical protein